MAVTTIPRPDVSVRLARFGRVVRITHWATAVLMLLLMATGAALYVPSLATWVGRREIVRNVHVWCGLLVPLPVLIGLAVSPTGLRRDFRRLARWDRLDIRWLRSLGRDRTAPPGKFNAGQKAFASFAGAAGLAMLGTGALMRWHEPFPLSWRTGATFVHDLTALALVVAVLGHIVKAVADPVALGSMFSGWVPASWAREHRPRWYAEFLAAGELSGERGPSPPPRIGPPPPRAGDARATGEINPD
jgi:formate dehydrogenase subunit gamma